MKRITLLMKNIFTVLALMSVLTLFCQAANDSDKKVNTILDKFSYASVQSEKQNIQSGESTTSQTSTNKLLQTQIDNNVKYVMITAGLYAFSLIIIIILMKMTPEHEARDLITIVGLLSVIFGAILLILMVGGTDQLTAPMGILGTIAGYLFGVTKKSENPVKQ